MMMLALVNAAEAQRLQPSDVESVAQPAGTLGRVDVA